MDRNVFVLIGVFAALAGGAAAFVLLSPGDRNEDIAPPDKAQAGQELAARDGRIAALEKENRDLRSEVRRLEELVERKERSGGMAPALPGGGGAHGTEAETTAAPASSPAPGGTSGGKPPGKEAVTWVSLAERLTGMLAMAKKQGDNPTPEFMQAVSGLMADIGKIQKELGFDDPGLVTEAPAFKAGFLAKMMEQEGKPLSTAEKAELDRISEAAMGEYLQAARGEPGEFALSRARNIVKCSKDFNDRLGRIVGEDRLAGLPGAEAKKNSGRAESTSWPDHCCIGVKDLEDAAAKVSEKWKVRMGIRQEDAPALQAIAREFVERSSAARTRTGIEKESSFTPEARAALDQELAGFEIDALRRIHDTMPLTEEGRKKVKGYRTLDRFEIGRGGAFSRSGSFGGIMISGGSEERTEGGTGPEEKK